MIFIVQKAIFMFVFMIISIVRSVTDSYSYDYSFSIAGVALLITYACTLYFWYSLAFILSSYIYF